MGITPCLVELSLVWFRLTPALRGDWGTLPTWAPAHPWSDPVTCSGHLPSKMLRVTRSLRLCPLPVSSADMPSAATPVSPTGVVPRP